MNILSSISFNLLHQHRTSTHKTNSKMNGYTTIAIGLALFVVYIKAGYIGGSYGGYELEANGIGYETGHQEEHHDYPKYKFNYAVHDPHTGDIKQQVEERDGDKVKGSYSLKEADGTTRVVEYHADKHNGFNAVVHRIGEPHKHIGEQHGGHYGGF